MERLGPPDADGTERVAVIALLERREAHARGLAAELLILERDAQRRLDGRRAGVGVEDAREPRRRDLHELVRQLDRRHAAESEQRRVCDAIELCPERGV